MENLNLLQQFLVCVAAICWSFALTLAIGNVLNDGRSKDFDDMA